VHYFYVAKAHFLFVAATQSPSANFIHGLSFAEQSVFLLQSTPGNLWHIFAVVLHLPLASLASQSFEPFFKHGFYTASHVGFLLQSVGSIVHCNWPSEHFGPFLASHFFIFGSKHDISGEHLYLLQSTGGNILH